jgi:hypothetical protein
MESHHIARLASSTAFDDQRRGYFEPAPVAMFRQNSLSEGDFGN